jgi:two-component system, NtrC family, sensor kinase
MALQRTIAAEYRSAPALPLPSGMNWRAIAVSLAAGVALGLLTFLVRVSLGQGIDPALHIQRLEQLSAASDLNTGLEQVLDYSRLSMDAQPGWLGQALDHLDAVRAGMLKSFGGGELGPEVNSALSAYLEAGDEQKKLIEPLGTQLADFQTHFKAVQQQGQALAARLQAPGQQALRRQVTSLVGLAARYAMQGSAEDGAALDELQTGIEAAAGPLPEADRAAIFQLASVVQDLRAGKDAMQDSISRFRALRMADILGQLRVAYLARNRVLERDRQRGRVVLAIYTGVLLVALVLLGLRLRRSFADLDTANAELVRANETLEQRIGERTRDLSKALENLRLQQAQLIQSEKMASLGQMVAGVAHEINTPLGYARSNVETVREVLAGLPRPDPAAGESLDESGLLLGDAEHGLERISELVLTLKDFSRVDRTRTELFDVNEAVETALKICHNQMKQRIEIQRDYGELPKIRCAPSQLNQVFLNLFNNAAQAIEGAGTIAISTRAAGEQVEVRIRDSGCGMDADVQAHIFEPFFTTKPVGQGTGLGLSIVYRIVEDHHGSVSVQSVPGQGTEFLVALPLRQPQGPAA